LATEEEPDGLTVLPSLPASFRAKGKLKMEIPAQEFGEDMSDTCRFSIVTATYKRAHLLGRVYASLASQTLRDLEWIVVDDGSTDETRDVIQAIEATAPILCSLSGAM
jgi:cellulose synthase/poly-beta-1,6-N-acetylglucosamine synthase-like glycosyltransferase